MRVNRPQWRENSSRKSVSFGPKFPTLKGLNFGICYSLKAHIWACSSPRVRSEYTSHTPGAFRELDPLAEVPGGVAPY